MSDKHLPAPALTLLASLQQLKTHYPHCRTLVIALSGGLDSMVLLQLCHLTRAQWAGWFDGGMRALHVHHGLSIHADHWLEFCKTACEQRAVPIKTVRAGLQLAHYRDQGESLEEAARHARYAVFENHLSADDVLLMAHHQDDQAETVLMHLLRGSGARGLSGIPWHRRLGQSQLWRPFIAADSGVSREQLQAYAEQAGLAWIEDESNNDLSLSRNFLRHQVMPVLKQEWPAMAATLSRTAALQAENEALLQTLAEQYLQLHQDAEEGSLEITALRQQSAAMQSLVLRHWLHGAADVWPDSQCIKALREEVLLAGDDAVPLLLWQGREIRRFRQRLYLMWPREAHVPAPDGGFLWQPAPDGRLPALVLPGNGTLRLIQVRQGGMPLPERACHVVYRHYSQHDLSAQENLLSGSFDCALAGRPRRPLKKILQESDLPPWDRSRVPLIFIGDKLAWIAGVGVCEGFQVAAGEVGWAVNWQMQVAEEPE
ncbi:MAG: tRNA lysidine(34) synthetase TilS [Gammaproteobacteria bacterium]|nr:tRNA lysidine(34) synthetase TilS [Gammaproteobacteria bacterium]